MFKNILLYIDPKINNKSMLECVVTITKKFACSVSLSAVVQPIPSLMALAIQKKYAKEIVKAKRDEAKEALTLASNFLESHSIDVSSVISEGITFVEIIGQVTKSNYDLIMLMTDSKKSSIAEKFFGSTQMQLLRKCPCPVWIVKPDSGPTFKRILTPIDAASNEDSETSMNHSLVKATKAMLTPGNESINFVQVWSVYGEGYLSARGGISEETINDLRRETLKEYKQCLKFVISGEDWTGAKIKKHFPHSNNPAEEIIKLVNKIDIDLLIMGTVCRTGIKGFIIGNTAEKVLNEVSCSVLAFKPDGFVSPVGAPVKN